MTFDPAVMSLFTVWGCKILQTVNLHATCRICYIEMGAFIWKSTTEASKLRVMSLVFLQQQGNCPEMYVHKKVLVFLQEGSCPEMYVHKKVEVKALSCE